MMGKINTLSVVVALFLMVPITFSTLYRTSAEEVSIVVTDKETKISRSNEDVKQKYLVFTENETFEVTDTWLFFRWSSSDDYGALKRGEKYRVKVAGWRVPFLSWYRNIVEVK